ncbi:hypothetical protein LCGC14_0520330 [marine sediment metagenome]|uniref:Uncharacterized protein n=1 Tax=marine sediment metagenome TaxID=412755 RepID=A0A0F9RYP6_9ZZZZ
MSYQCGRCGTEIKSGLDGVLQQKDYDALCWACYDVTITEEREAAQIEEANREAAKQEGMREEDAEAEA